MIKQAMKMLIIHYVMSKLKQFRHNIMIQLDSRNQIFKNGKCIILTVVKFVIEINLLQERVNNNWKKFSDDFS